MNVTIKKAYIENIDELMKWRITVLREVFSVPLEKSLSDLEKENREYYLSEIESGGHIACFAYDGDKIIGCGGVCIYREMPSPDNPSGKCAYLMNIFTDPNYRKNGVGKDVVEWLIAQAKSRGITKIYLETSSAGRALYRNLGFEDMRDMMKLKQRRNYADHQGN